MLDLTLANGFPLLPTFVSAVLVFVLGALWYSPAMFLNVWQKHMGVSNTSEAMNAKTFIATWLWWLFVAAIFSLLITTLSINTHSLDLIVFVVLIWFVAGKTPLVMSSLYQGRSSIGLSVDGGFQFCALLVMAGVHMAFAHF